MKHLPVVRKGNITNIEETQVHQTSEKQKNRKMKKVRRELITSKCKHQI